MNDPLRLKDLAGFSAFPERVPIVWLHRSKRQPMWLALDDETWTHQILCPRDCQVTAMAVRG